MLTKDTFENIMEQFRDILSEADNNVQLVSAIKAIGMFSRAIKYFMGERQLLGYLERLIELSEYRLMKEFEDQKSPLHEMQNFKFILRRQKQLINYIESYSFMMHRLESEPAEKVQAHFFKVCIIGVANHRKLYDKYRHRFYEALARLVSSLAVHPEHFPAWIRKFVRRTF